MSPDANLFLLDVPDDGNDGVHGPVPGDGDGKPELVLFDRAANTVRKVSVLPDGTNLGGAVYQAGPHPDMADAFVSSDGSRLFFSTDLQLLPSDTYSSRDLYSLSLRSSTPTSASGGRR